MPTQKIIEGVSIPLRQMETLDADLCLPIQTTNFRDYEGGPWIQATVNVTAGGSVVLVFEGPDGMRQYMVSVDDMMEAAKAAYRKARGCDDAPPKPAVPHVCECGDCDQK